MNLFGTVEVIKNGEHFLFEIREDNYDDAWMQIMFNLRRSIKNRLKDGKSPKITIDPDIEGVEECQSCGTIVYPSDKEAATSDQDPGCPNCGSTDFLEA